MFSLTCFFLLFHVTRKCRVSHVTCEMFLLEGAALDPVAPAGPGCGQDDSLIKDFLKQKVRVTLTKGD